MAKCSYTWEDWDEEKEEIERRCQEETWEGSDEFCIFHDPSPKKNVDLFKEELEKQMQSETEGHNFVGYYFPKGGSDFKDQKFTVDVNFRGAIFQGNANFWGATFLGNADFSGVIFYDVNFEGATFQGNADFLGAAFPDANFFGAIFQGNADFLGATFLDADFREAIFQGNADFWEATFLDAYFTSTTFHEDANFKGTTFQKIELDSRSTQKLDLRYSEFLSRSYVTINLEKTLFHRAFLENLAFIDCTWPDKMILYEEKCMNDEGIDLSYNQLETIYRDLKQNMQRHGDYKTAGEFYYREMECRKESMRKKRFSLDWFKSFGYSLLKYTCGYGEKPERTVLSSLFTIFAFAIFYWTTECLQHTMRRSIENPTIYQGLKDAIYFSFVTFTTLGLGDISPLNDLGKLLICCEAIIGAFLIALFVVVFTRKMMR